ncbi:MAG: serine hydrolase [Gammaproteobacteria bacterium]
MTIARLPCAFVLACLCGGAAAYPIDGFETTGIGRLDEARRIQEGTRTGTKQPRGALLSIEQVDIRLAGRPDFAIPAPDPELSAQVRALLGDKADRYNIALLDLSDPQRPVYAEHNARELRNPGSVGKLLVALAFFQALADLYPDDIEARKRLLRDTEVTADDFVLTDHHTVRNFDPATGVLVRRQLLPGDKASLWEYMDWMISASSNSAAAAVMKELMLLRRFGREYPVPAARANAYLRETSKSQLRTDLLDAMLPPVTRSGLDLAQFRQGSFFTRTGKRHVSGTSSHGNAHEILKFLLLMEQGRLVDEFSSREIKRLMYQTERRIRYASSPVLFGDAVYFKSGSLFECKPEPDFRCRPYQGNIKNFMNSAAIVESPAGERKLHYLIGLMSNVLRRNSAVDHQALAGRLHRLLQQRHGLVKPAPTSSAGPSTEE